MIFEEFEFASAYRCLGGPTKLPILSLSLPTHSPASNERRAGPTLNAYNDIPTLMGDPPSLTPTPQPREALLVVDAGHSHTTITPILRGQPIHRAIRRLDIGGKLLTNRLKETISLRHFSLMDEPHLVGQIKEDACYVSLDFAGDLARTWRDGSGKKSARVDDITLDYVLPDYHTTTRGHTRPHDPSRAAAATATRLAGAGEQDSFPLGNERFAVPELLFNPTDLGMAQAGLPEAIVQSVSALPEGLWPVMLANVVVVGGTAGLPGFVERLEEELRAVVRGEVVVRVRRPVR